MNLYRFAYHKTIVSILYLLSTLQATHQISSNEETADYKQQRLNYGAISSPYLVLMSDKSVAVAQLPMILFGNVSDVYTLPSEDYLDRPPESEIEKEGLRFVGSDDGHSNERRIRHATATDADVGAHLPDMSANTATSLGKSEWQQIAIGARAGERRNLEQAQGNDVEDPANSKPREQDERYLGRQPRSSNSLRDHADDSGRGSSADPGDGSAPGNTTKKEDRASANDQQAVLSSHMQNVTSAAASSQLDGVEQQQQQQRPKLAPESVGTPAEDDDKIAGSSGRSLAREPGPSLVPSLRESELRPGASSSGTVQFSDLDVHMALGYAFVTDSAGRIHRIKLPVVSESTAALRVGSPAESHTPAEVSTTSERSGDDTTNTINSDDKLDPAAASSQSRAVNATESVAGESARRPNRYSTVGSDASESRTVVDDANKSGRTQSDDVTHEGTENESQHPVISGAQNGRTDPSSSEITASGGFQTATVQRALSLDTMVENAEHDDAKPRIVWSRSRSARWPVSGVIGLHSAKQRDGQQQQLVDGGGALPARDTTQVDGSERTSFGRRSEAPASASRQIGPADQRDNEIQNERPHSTGDGAEVGGKHSGRQLATQIAVDWLNNLIFVLDRYRLLVMELDGSNELTLIDDFNPNNRPVDIKVDPINSFLFWLQVGKFHNTIYKLDLDILSMPRAKQNGLINTSKPRHSTSGSGGNGDDSFGYDARELASLMSHHDALPVITNLPRNTRMFTIDHGNSKVYVPIYPPPNGSNSSDPAKNDDTQSMRDETEVFAPTDDITHLNSTQANSSSANIDCHQNDLEPSEAQLLAYNLDGTDVGLLRAFEDRNNVDKLGGIQDLSIKSESGPLLLLMNDGRELYEEIKNQSSTIHPLGGTSYSKMVLVENNHANQPAKRRPRFNVRRQVMDILSSYRPTRSEFDHSNLGLIGPKDDGANASRGAPYMILLITCLVVVTIYLIYSLIFQRIQARQRSRASDHGANESLSGAASSINSDFQATDNLNGIMHSTTISRWVAGPSARNTETSTFDRDINSFNERIGAYDIESNYDASNAIDEHYRGSQIRSIDERTLRAPTSRLANLSEWPSNMHDLSNKLYVPVEVLQDEALSSIRRVTIEQLDIEHWKAPLGEGHFGTVLQGTIDCSKYRIDSSQRVVIPCRAPISPDSLAPPSRSRMFVPSTSSSGHGSSSSASCEFATANTCTEPTSHNDYLTPRNQSSSTASDFVIELPGTSSPDGDFYNDVHEATCFRTTAASLVGNRLKVAIKKLKDHASPEEKRDFLQEAKLLANFNHPNIVQLIGICLDRGSTLIVMELMLGGDLTRYMRENTPRATEEQNDELSCDDLLKICLDIANGCCYLEDMDYIHRDLAARNCLVSSRKREERVVKLADFGLARDIYKSSYYMMSKDKAMPMKWMAPECLTEQRFTKKSDVWSFGVVMWEVMSYCQEKPYVDVEPFFMKEHLATGARLRKPIACDDSMYKLMNQCWQIEPEQRPTFHECRAMLIEIRSSGQL